MREKSYAPPIHRGVNSPPQTQVLMSQIQDFLRCRRGPEESHTRPVSQALSKLFWIFGDSLSFTKVEARRRLHSSQPLVQQAHYKTWVIPSKVAYLKAFEKENMKISF